MLRRAAFVVALISGVTYVHADTSSPVPAAYQQEIQQWRDKRVANLTSPTGWLSLIGLEWLKEGDNRVGSAADNDIVLTAGPAHLGAIHLDAHGAMHIVLADHAGATIDGKSVRESALVDDMHAGEAGPTLVAFGSASFFVIDREGRKGLRIKDTAAPTRKSFSGIDYFPVDAAWRIEAEWVPFDPPQTLEIGTVIGTIEKVDVPGKAVFHHDGHTFELLPYQEEPGGELFFVLADQTSGRETYGAARFLYAALPKDGKVILDFNKAYNPPCAFTPFATCPLAPPENRLDVAIRAGEKKYTGGH
ncbi:MULTISPECIES: DUF1684 domain-containing protein [Dyella]|uniref:DUF1684 domain-containing protein n=2 Tax=Dyella TaxID=231454 RepID=A0A4R0Z1U6_9GAMM|nr:MULTISPECIES: DUF1684 domain-containing protein [Dyella]TBR39020.1 DUF1684 domain-containing protein [Dyella terrae]TCI13388.1 DUF1684 domain-containing protein [Dyella soli]